MNHHILNHDHLFIEKLSKFFIYFHTLSFIVFIGNFSLIKAFSISKNLPPLEIYAKFSKIVTAFRASSSYLFIFIFTFIFINVLYLDFVVQTSII